MVVLRATILALLLSAAPLVRAQTAPAVPTSPLGALARRLGNAPAPAAKAGTAPSAGRFKPSGKRLTFEQLAATIGQDAAQRKALVQIMEATASAFEKELRSRGQAADLSSALTFLVATSWGLAVDKTPGEKATDALLAQVAATMTGPELDALSDRDRQISWEFCVGMSGMLLGLKEAATDDASRKGVRALASAVFEKTVGVAPGRIAIDDGGFRAAVERVTPAPVNLDYRLPAGWTEAREEAGVTLSRSIPTDAGGMRIEVIVLQGAAQGGAPEALCPPMYRRYVQKYLPDDVTIQGTRIKDILPEVGRRFVGNGLRCAFSGISWQKYKDGIDYFGTSQEVLLYAIESGGQIVPVVVVMNGHKGAPAGGNGTAEIGERERLNLLEALLATVAGTPSGKPLFSRAELAGEYELSSGAMGPSYVNAITGASIGMGFVSRSSKLRLAADGSYSGLDAGASGIGTATQFVSQKHTGTYRLEQDRFGTHLILLPSSKIFTRRERLAGLTKLPDGRKVLITLPARFYATGSTLRTEADRYYTKKP
jgi:hypothetical protein